MVTRVVFYSPAHNLVFQEITDLRGNVAVCSVAAVGGDVLTLTNRARHDDYLIVAKFFSHKLGR